MGARSRKTQNAAWLRRERGGGMAKGKPSPKQREIRLSGGSNLHA